MQKTKFKFQDLSGMLSKENLVIFLFHGVINKQTDSIRNYNNKHLEKDFFANSIKELSKKGISLSMQEVVFHIKNKIPFPKNSYSITFDDGFENNISIAAPILSDYKTYATIYITTNFIENNLMSWIDKIENAVQEFKQKEFKFEGINYDLSSIEKKISFLELIRFEIKKNSKINPNSFANKICDSLGNNINSQDHQLDLKMNWDQVIAAHNSEYLSIGGHSHSHKTLSYLNKYELKKEIELSLNLMKSKANISTRHYSYPEGLSNCFNQTVISELKNNGIECCPSAIFGFNDIGTSLFHLKRVQVA